MATLTTSYQKLAEKYLGSSYGDLYVRIYAKYSEQDIVNNKTKVQYQARAYFSGTYIKDNQGSGYVLGTSASKETGACTYPEKGETVIATTEAWVEHSSDGKKSITASAYLNFPNWEWSGTASGTADLPTIPRQATLLTAPNFSDGENPTITYSNPAGNAVSSLEAAIYNTAGGLSYAPYRAISKTETSYTFNLTEAEKENLRKATQGSNSLPISFYVRTKIGDVTYIADPVKRTFTITDANPIITATVEDADSTTIALTGDKNKLIKYFSNAKATMSVEAQKGAAIDESLYIIRNGDDSAYTTSCIFENVESNQFTFSAEDSRGNIGSENITLPMVNYIKLTCNIANNRPDALGNMNVACSGNYFNDTFGAVANTLTVQYRYTTAGSAFSDNWTNMTVTKVGNTYYASADFDIPNFNQSQSYSFETRAIDKLMTVSSAESAVKSMPIFHWGENDFVFEVPVSFNAGVTGATSTASTEDDTYVGNKTITGNLRLKGDGTNYGNYLLFGDSTFCYIAELTDDIMTIHAKKINLDASSGVFVGGYAIPTLDKGTWTPALNSSAISSYTTQYGWYSKMGQSVTIGFYIKATCKSGYTSTSISISGVPFTPLYPSAGGGMCSGAYVAANQNFQCYVVETDKTITTRTQACNNTASTNLTTSASGCWYRSSGGEITLSGTITFIANS